MSKLKNCQGDFPNGTARTSGKRKMLVICDNGYELKQPDEKYTCEKVKGKKNRRKITPKPECIR